MNLYQENGYEHMSSYTTFSWNKQNIQRRRHPWELKEALGHYRTQQDKNKGQAPTFLLHEKRFAYYKFDIHESFDSPCSIAYIKRRIQHKINELGRILRGDRLLFYSIENIYIDGVPSTYIYAKTGRIFCSINLVFLKAETMNIVKRKKAQNLIHENKASSCIYPRSYRTIGYLTNTLHRQNFHMLDIQSHCISCYHIKDGFYNKIHTANRGSGLLRDMYEEHGISHLFHSNHQSHKPWIQDAIQKATNFFVHMLIKRVQQYIQPHTDIILISDLRKHEAFDKALDKWYNKHINGFILPFRAKQSLPTFDKKRRSEDIHSLCYLAQIKPQFSKS